MRRGGGAPQGESLATWAMWAVVLVMILVTYWRLEPDTRAALDLQGWTEEDVFAH